MNETRRIFSYADFERAFDGLDGDSSLVYAVNHLLLTGGGTCWIERVADNAFGATVAMETTGGTVTLAATASSEEVRGNDLVLAVGARHRRPCQHVQPDGH